MFFDALINILDTHRHYCYYGSDISVIKMYLSKNGVQGCALNERVNYIMKRFQCLLHGNGWVNKYRGNGYTRNNRRTAQSGVFCAVHADGI
jgi:hypothetical protein